MPVFTQQKKEKAKPGRKAREIPRELLDEYKRYIMQLGRGNQGLLEFKRDENISLARRALQQASVEIKKYVRVRKLRGKAHALSFERITRKEWIESQKSAKARGAKLKGRPKGKTKKKI